MVIYFQLFVVRVLIFSVQTESVIRCFSDWLDRH